MTTQECDGCATSNGKDRGAKCLFQKVLEARSDGVTVDVGFNPQRMVRQIPVNPNRA